MLRIKHKICCSDLSQIKLYQFMEYRGECECFTLVYQIVSSLWLIREVSELSKRGETITKTISRGGLL